MSKIPGLEKITDVATEDGGCTITLHIESGRADEFFHTFDLAPGDDAGLQKLMIQAIENYLVEQGHTINRPA